MESLDGFFAALSCCPDLVMPSEYLPIIKSSTSDEGELIFEDMNEAERFMNVSGAYGPWYRVLI